MSGRLIFGYTVLAAFGVALLVVTILLIRVVSLDTETEATPRSTQAAYVVQEGDSLAAISKETGIPLEEIEELNPRLDPLALVPGERIRLREPTPAERRRLARRRANLPRRYKVKRGDGVLLIAEKTNVDVAQLYRLNPDKKLKNLTPGMRLRLRR